MASQPGLPGSQVPKGDDWLVRRVQDLERELREMKAAVGAQSNVTFGQGGIIVRDGYISIKDTGGVELARLDASGLLVTGTETVSGTLNVTGNTVIGGTLSLPNGIIDNAALVSPVRVDQADGTSAGWTFDSTERPYTTQGLTVPAGFTNALVFATATVGLSANAGGSFVSARPVIEGDLGELITSQAGANIAMSVSSTHSAWLTGVSGTISVTARARGTTGGVVAGSGNARISAIAIFLR